MGQDCISPPAHTAYSNPCEMMEFVAQLRELSGGKPAGFKLCIGRRSEFLSIVKGMLKTGITPDFIVVDGSEGGTGAAPLEFSRSLGLADQRRSFAFVHTSLVGAGLRDKSQDRRQRQDRVRFRLGRPRWRWARTPAMSRRPFMFTVGCIQALRCHTNKCPTGVATQDSDRYGAIDVDSKRHAVAGYHEKNHREFSGSDGSHGHRSA